MRRFASFTAAVALLLVVSLPLNNAVVDVVGPWNKLVRDVVVAHKLGTSDSSRIMASLHLAQFQAVTDLLSTQHKTAADVDKDPQLHAEVLAAVAGAGKSVLEKISYAGQKPEDGFIFAGPAYNALLAAQIGPDQRSLDVSNKAASIGQALVASRADDGADAKAPEYKGSNEPGKWRPTPPDFKAGAEPHWGQVRTWVLPSVAPLRMNPPPPLDSARFRMSYDEVRELGRKESPTRTANETEIAAFWGKSPELPWFAALEHVVSTANTTASPGTGLGVVDATRAYALASLAFADSRIAAMDNKYFYSMWRPESSLAEGNGVGFPKDAEYRSFLATPNTPEYPSGHGSLAATFAVVLQSLNGGKDELASPLSVTAAGTDGPITRKFTSLNQTRDETSVSRVYAGDHFRHSADASVVLGTKAGEAVLAAFDKKFPLPGAAAATAVPKAKDGKRTLRRA